ncbi:hypothetical protein Ava_B0244 (plasmid) [Trichormus variabilis ATCC 29413]|uniref:Uncharacterized protein n=1 Tax=Trichormus variabilis (strain ATCC 29413 / PCC 7937) TaxID=240292 RepID=Q3M231_TRIV2|nr:hypothetical protein Ava_B0244 [Trichormus variabilis ATCC 29413]
MRLAIAQFQLVYKTKTVTAKAFHDARQTFCRASLSCISQPKAWNCSDAVPPLCRKLCTFEGSISLQESL